MVSCTTLGLHILCLLSERRARRIVNSVISACVICKRHQGRYYPYPNPTGLPAERVNRTRPFGSIGLDYFGPLMIRSDNGQDRKTWVCLFTCMTTRAIHLEVVADNSTIQFLLAFRRFISGRGTPELVLSDNAPTFKLGRKVLVNELKKLAEDKVVKDFSTSSGLTWRFITPLSPWKGGFYERLVGSVKTALKRTVHRRTLDLWNLQTLLSENEATLNTRPLTPISGASTDETHILRPIDLISPQFSLGFSISLDPRLQQETPSSTTNRLRNNSFAITAFLETRWRTSGISGTGTICRRSQSEPSFAPRRTKAITRIW